MRILLVSNGYPPRGRFGTEFYTRELALALLSRGHAVMVLCPDRSASRPRLTLEREIVEGVVVLRLHNPGDRWKRFARSFEDPEIEGLVRGVLEREPADVVHFLYLLWGLSARLPLIVRDLGGASVLTATDHALVCHRGQMLDHESRPCGGPQPARVCARCIRTTARHGAAPFTRLSKSLLAAGMASLGGVGLVATEADLRRRNAAVLEGLRAVATIIAPTWPIAEALVRFGVAREKLVELLYSFDETPYLPLRTRPGPATARLGFVGQIAPHKGVATFLEAARLLGRRDPAAGFEVVLHGAPSEGRHARYARTLLRDLEAAHARLSRPFGPEEAPAVFDGFSALVVPSTWDENAPLSVLQARAAGIPVIASEVPGIRAIVEDGVHGRLVPPNDPAALAAALGEVVDRRLRRPGPAGLPLSLARHLDELEALYGKAREGTR